MIAQAMLRCQHDWISGVNEPLRYALRPTVITMVLRRWKPSSIDACSTLVISLENATRGELAILRTAVENATSERIKLQSSSKDVSVPDIRFSAFSAIAGKGGILSGSHRSSVASRAWDVSVARVITFPCRVRFVLHATSVRGKIRERTTGLPDYSIGNLVCFHE